MCEPHHSINQYPDDDVNPGDNTGSDGTSLNRLLVGLGKGLGDWLKKIGNFFHLSKVGSGHSESMEWARTKARLNWLPDSVKYEVKWWDRTVRFDGNYDRLLRSWTAEALECASRYARAVSTGSLTHLRHFLEASMRRTENPVGYVDMFVQGLLNGKGRDAVHTKQRVAFSDHKSLVHALIKKGEENRTTWVNKAMLTPVIKFLLGFTRKREYLNDAWAMDDKLWLPQEPRLILMPG